MASAAKTSRSHRDLWERFRSDEESLARHAVTEDELQLLEGIALFGSLKSVRDILFVLKNIRG
jgi:hypothetical protein